MEEGGGGGLPLVFAQVALKADVSARLHGTKELFSEFAVVSMKNTIRLLSIGQEEPGLGLK